MWQEEAMTTELAPFRQQAARQSKAPTGSETARRGTIATSIVPMKTLYLELSVTRGSFENEATEPQRERHPEWYIG